MKANEAFVKSCYSSVKRKDTLKIHLDKEIDIACLEGRTDTAFEFGRHETKIMERLAEEYEKEGFKVKVLHTSYLSRLFYNFAQIVIRWEK